MSETHDGGQTHHHCGRLLFLTNISDGIQIFCGLATFKLLKNLHFILPGYYNLPEKRLRNGIYSTGNKSKQI